VNKKEMSQMSQMSQYYENPVGVAMTVSLFHGVERDVCFEERE